MITYQDYLEIPNTDIARADFVRKVISEHKASAAYKMAELAEDYDKGENTTTMQYQKMITTVTGAVVPDRFSATHRSCSMFFNIFTSQLNQYLLGNGVKWQDKDKAEEVLGKDFDTRLQELGKKAISAGTAFGFFNSGKVHVFGLLEYAPVLDEETSEMRCGARFWQVDKDKPLRATWYEQDGFTSFMWTKKKPTDERWIDLGKDTYMQPKKPYTWVSVGDAKDRADGTDEVVPGDPVNGFPIIPLYGNPYKQSELTNMRSKIDAYDFILNGFEDDLDNAQIYWIIKGAGGMEDLDLQQFLERLKTVKAAAPADGQDVQPVHVEIPFAARETLLARLERQLYRDAMIMNPEDIEGGAVTATQIEAAYERQNIKADQYEYCVLDFLDKLMELVGLDEKPTFDRSMVINRNEELQMVISSAQFLDEDYVVRKILSILGDGDQADEILERRAAMELEQINMGAENE